MLKPIQKIVGAVADKKHAYGKSLVEHINDKGVAVFKPVNLKYEPKEYADCEKHGKYVSIIGNGDPFKDQYFDECPDCIKERKTKKRLGGRDGVAKRFQRCSFENYKVSNPNQKEVKEVMQEFAENFHQHLDAGTPVLLLGGVGTGKTHLASAIANHIAIDGYDTIFRSVSGIIRSIRDSWGKSGEESKLIEIYKTVDLLIIDEVGVQNGTPNERNILFDIINARYEDVMPTIMITNCKFDKFTEQVGLRIASRIQHNGTYIPFDWEDYRQQ